MENKKEDKEKKCQCENCECEDCNCEDNKECTCECCHEGKHEKHNKKHCVEHKEYEKLKSELAEANDRCIRIQAEMMNFKRRKEEETSLRLKYCNEDLLLKLVQIADNFERAIKMDDANLTDEVSKFLEGFKIMYANLLEILRANEVVEIDVLGKPFDPKTSEALLVEHFDDKAPNEVVDILQKGYMYKDKLLRSAMVKINDGE